MYPPPWFRTHDRTRLLEAIRRYPFATILAVDDEGRVEVAQAPTLLDEEGRSLQFHLARNNAVARLLEEGRPAQLLFLGPDAYVSPTWYAEPHTNVPTWNYVTVLVRAPSARPLDARELREHLRRSAARFEAEAGSEDWSLDLLDDRDVAKALPLIRGFEVRLEHLEGRFKLSQNRAPADRERVRLRLAESVDSRARELAEWMEPGSFE